MKALSIRQPWANMIAGGAKTIETRTWWTDHRGPLLIVSTKLPAIPPAGFALAVAELVDCRPMRRSDEPSARCRYEPGLYSWILRGIRPVPPFPVRGKTGLFEVPDASFPPASRLQTDNDS